jgi:hypothetical protein
MKRLTTWLRVGGLVAALALLAGLNVAVAASGERSTERSRRGLAQPALAWTRTLEPVILSGGQVPLFDGAPGDELLAYAYDGDNWQPIPLQFDEVDASGVYTAEDGLLDANDELVFMARDLGQPATPSEWPDDAESRAYPRYEVQVSNPLNPAELGWVYLYRSTTLAPSPVDYVSWEAANNRLLGGTYVLGLAPEILGINWLELNGSGVNALDRTKLRLNATCWLGPIPLWTDTLSEEDLAALVGPADPTPDVDGPVRVGGGSTQASSWSYSSIYQSGAAIDLGSFDPPAPCTSLVLNWARLSVDWLDPAATGMAPATYYDDNTPGGVAIDGTPDSIAASPANAWKQVSGGQGSAVQVADVTLGSGTLTNYYKDDAIDDPDDTGDGRSYGDAGFRVDSPAGEVVFHLTTYVLDPGQPNVGAAYQSYQANPLQATATAQSYEPPCEPGGVDFTWAPRPVHVGVTTTLTATVASGQPPFTFTWTFGDDGSLVAGNPVTHVFALSGTFPVSLTVSNACSTAAPLVHLILVSEPGTTKLVYLPLVVRDAP